MTILLAILAVSTLVVSGAGNRNNPESTVAQIMRLFSLDHFYESPLNSGLWLTLCAVMLMAIFLKGMPGFTQKLLHFLLVAIFLLIFYDKAVNQRFVISIREGQEVNFASFIKSPDPAYEIPLRLLKFEIRLHPDSNIPAAYTSRLLVNRADTTTLAVNQPVSIGRYRLYQSAYHQDNLVAVISGNDTLITPINTPFYLNQKEIVLRDFDHLSQTFVVETNQIKFQIPPGEISNVAGQQIKLEPLSPKYTSIIEAADVTGLNILAFLGVMYLVVLAYIFGWKQNR